MNNNIPMTRCKLQQDLYLTEQQLQYLGMIQASFSIKFSNIN